MGKAEEIGILVQFTVHFGEIKELVHKWRTSRQTQIGTLFAEQLHQFGTVLESVEETLQSTKDRSQRFQIKFDNVGGKQIEEFERFHSADGIAHFLRERIAMEPRSTNGPISKKRQLNNF